MFVGRTGLCHDDEDPVECSGGRKLFYTAYGDPICDCPPGHFPYPNSRDNCLALFTQGPCRDELVLSFSSERQVSLSVNSKDSSRPVAPNKKMFLLVTSSVDCYRLTTVSIIPWGLPVRVALHFYSTMTSCNSNRHAQLLRMEIMTAIIT